MESTITKALVEAIAGTLDASAREYAHARVTGDGDEGAREFACAYLEGLAISIGEAGAAQCRDDEEWSPEDFLKGDRDALAEAAKALKVEVTSKDWRILLGHYQSAESAASRSYKIEVSSDRDANTNSRNPSLWTSEGIGEAEGWDLKGAKKAAKAALAFEGVKASRVVDEGTGETVASYKSA
jgi:hypothetical protein